MSSAPAHDLLDNAVIARLNRLTVSARQPMLGGVSGLHRSAARGSSVEFAEYRKYAAGDDIRSLDWRVYARTDRFYIKEYEADTNLRCHLVVDASGSMAFAHAHGTRFDYARRMAATLAYMLVRQGDAVGLHVSGPQAREVPARRNPAHLQNLFEALRTARPEGEVNVVARLHEIAERVRGRALVLLFSDLFAPVDTLLDAFQHLRFKKHDLAIFHLLDAQELDFDFDRPIRFVDLEGGEDLIADPSVIRADYRSALDRHLAALRHGCRQNGVDYHLIQTRADVERVLSAFMLARMSRKTGARR
jgi:uncharacterized protein (DUF58 family)